MKLGEIIKEYRLEHKMSMDRFATASGITKGYISMLEKNEHPKSKKPIIPTNETILKVAQGMNVEIDFILNKLDPDQEIQINVRPDFLEDKTSPSPAPQNVTVQAINNKVIQLDPDRQENVLEYATEQLEEQEKEEQQKKNAHFIEEPLAYYSVDTVTELAAGLGYSYEDNDIRTVQVEDKPPRHDLASIVNGDSMLPDYENGDIVYLKDTGFSSYSGQVCAIAINDKSYLKKVYTEDDCLRLVSLNPKYDDIIIDFPPSSDTHIKIYAVIGSDTPIER